MANDLYRANYNPDVLSCIANLSNDEVFTPPEVANAMLDLLPPELFTSPDTKILDPVCKSGVFLREAAKRLISGLEPVYPDLQTRLDHIYKEQLYGIAITELTSLLSRRSVYCSKYANSRFSVVPFADIQGNIRYKKIKHVWRDGRCAFCGASQSQYDRADDLESHAYEFIHTTKPEDIFKMKFDVIIGNPPYQLSDGGNGVSAKPIYNMFVEKAIELSPKYVVMITPSRWFAGGKGLDSFRDKMLHDKHIERIVDYQNAKDCFPGLSIGGGISYFLWNKSHEGTCQITNIINGRQNDQIRDLDEYPVFVRYNEAIGIIHKLAKNCENNMTEIISSRNPFGIPTNYRGHENKSLGDLTLYSSQGISYIKENEIVQGKSNVEKYKVMISRITSEHAGEPDKNGQYKVISKIVVLKPDEICTDSYIIACPSSNLDEVNNCYNYLSTKLVRFLILQTLSSINLSKERYCFVPIQDFSKPWTDEELYAKYGLTDDEIAFIESMIKPMDADAGGE